MERNTFFKLESQPYKTGNTVKDTFHGTDYQINVLILYAFKNFIKNPPVEFELRTEGVDYGKFDDVQLILKDSVKVLQVKHSKDSNGVYTINHLTTDNEKKVQLYTYFDSWFDHKEETNTKFIIFSNHTLDTEFGLHHCLDENTHKFIDEFINNPNPPKTEKKKLKKPKREDSDSTQIKISSDEVYRTIKSNSVKLANIQSESEKNNYVKRFLGTIELHLGEKSVEVLADDLKEQFRKYFNTTNDAIYNAFYWEIKEWLRKENVNSHSHETIKNLFDQTEQRFLLLERMVGMGKLHLSSIYGTINGKSYKRNPGVNKITEFLESKTERILTIVGNSGLGKSTLIKQYLEEKSQFKDGEYLIFFSNSLENDYLSLIKQPAVKFVVIDSLEIFSNETHHKFLKEIISICSKNKKKIIILTQPKTLSNLSDDIDIPVGKKTTEFSLASIPIEYVNKHFLPLSSLSKSESNSVFESELEAETNQDIKFPAYFEEILGNPFFLNLVVRYNVNLQKLTSEVGVNQLRDYLIDISIKGMENFKTNNQPLIKARKSILRSIIFMQSRFKQDFVALEFETEILKHALQTLINDHLVIIQNNLYSFSHDIFKERIGITIAERILNHCLEAKINLAKTIGAFYEVLPSHVYVWEEYLTKHPDFYQSDMQNLDFNYDEVNEYPLSIGEQIIVQAIKNNDNKLLKIALRALNYSVNTVYSDEEIFSNMFYAISKGNTKAVGILLKYEIDPNQPDMELPDNSNNKYKDFDYYFIDDVADIKPCKYIFKQVNHDESLDEVYNNFINPHHLFQYEYFAINKAHYLATAVMYHQDNILKLLLNAPGIKIDHQNHLGETALHIAVNKSRVKAVSLLLKAGAKVDILDCEEENPLHNVIHVENIEILEKLLKHLSPNKLILAECINQKNIAGWTPLHLALLQRNQQIINLLIKFGAKTIGKEVTDKQKLSPQDLLDEINENDENAELFFPTADEAEYSQNQLSYKRNNFSP